ncbi:hypothetical protein HPP92_004822 [Vanilla planifolia]|uniref:Uncharacterized protein n=1 Tax=Vanilla planifolia TaxID=51239 RepID=A0A835V8H4_VANPL|nr:hypothetical protein HPP92_004822 [Vanilla planifolia]
MQRKKGMEMFKCVAKHKLEIEINLAIGLSVAIVNLIDVINSAVPFLAWGKLLRYSWSDEEICIAGGKRDCTLLQNPLKLSSAYTGVQHSSDLLPVRVLETFAYK